jgi:hypothetical protein
MRGPRPRIVALMIYQLAPSLHAAFIGEHVVLLDTKHDRYRMIGQVGATVLRAIGTADVSRHAAAFEALRTIGIVERGSEPLRVATIASPTWSAIEAHPEYAPSARVGSVRIASAVAEATLGLRLRGLAAMLERVRRRSATGVGDGNGTVALAQEYQRKRRKLPIARVCLADSIALHHILHKAGECATFVIGVRLHPFAAHCWLQSDEVLLNDSCDAVSGYTPILVL